MSTFTTTREEQMFILWSWFDSWGPHQRLKFLDFLVSKVVPHQVCSLYDAMDSLEIQDNNGQDIYQCQLRMGEKWLRTWTDAEKNKFVDGLEARDYESIKYFYDKVSQTAQEP